MSLSRQRAPDVVSLYDVSLEQQIVSQGSSLVCRDEELWKHVEGLLRDGCALDVHSLGLDPLRLMEESLQGAAGAAAASDGRLKPSGGLQALAKAFEVLEQAALNLYLRPWREEYKVVKMYTGMFTHYIKPVLSMPQIEQVFSLLGYEPGASRHEHLLLQSPRAGRACVDQLLRLACAFYLARCECCLLVDALGRHAGDGQWELSVVRERQRGSIMQVSLENTKKSLEVQQPQPSDGESDVDLYMDDVQVNGRQRAAVPHDDESPRSLTWLAQSAPAVFTHSNGMKAQSSSSTREPVCISTLQLTKTSHPEPASTRQARRSYEESAVEVDSLRPPLGRVDANLRCSCVQTPDACVKLCIGCNTLHDIDCVLLKRCHAEGHCVAFHDNLRDMKNVCSVSAHNERLRVSDMTGASPLSTSVGAMSSLALCDDPTSTKPSLHPITYHSCCDLALPDPQVLCLSCNVFHSDPCEFMMYVCISSDHHTKQLGDCACGKQCSRKPMVLCRYCGKEYCNDCWYRSPVECTCGQTFDQSSSV